MSKETVEPNAVGNGVEGAGFSIEGQYNPTVTIPDPTNEPAKPADQGEGKDGGQGSGVNTTTTEIFTEELATELGGVRFDENGNLINEKGTIIKTRKKVEEAAAQAADEKKNEAAVADNGATEGEGDDAVFLDDEGNLVDDSGKVIRKKDTFTYDEKTGTVTYDDPIIPGLAEHFRERGYQLIDNEGTPMQFEDDEAGMEALAIAIATEHFQNYEEQWAAANPELLRFRNHIANGGDPYEFYRENSVARNYKELDIAEDDESGMLSIIADRYRIMHNMQEGEIAEVIDMIKTKGEVKDKYNSAIAALRKHQETKDAEETVRYKEQVKAEQQQRDQYWSEVRGIVKSKKIGDIVLTDKQASDFYNKLTKVGDDGMTESERAYNQLSLEERLQLQFQVLYKQDLDKYIEAKAKTASAQSLRERARKRVTIAGKSPKLRKSGNADADIPGIGQIV